MLKPSHGAHARKSLPLAACLVGVALLWPRVGLAEADGPFASLSGAWRGDGAATGADGKSEHIACRATNTISFDKINLTQSLVCASDSYRFDIRANIFTDGQAIRGTWQEATRNVSGNFSGDMRDGSINGAVTAPGFTATVSITTAGDKEQVTIVPHGSDIAKVEIALTRRG
jgi:hypothetical protein